MQPRHVRNPFLRLLAHVVDVEGGTTFEEATEMVWGQLIGHHLHFKGEQQLVQDLVPLEESTAYVEERGEGKLLDD